VPGVPWCWHPWPPRRALPVWRRPWKWTSSSFTLASVSASGNSRSKSP
jgi:hypothetical protein